jgi:HSP20 family molecular chaperone IbpA
MDTSPLNEIFKQFGTTSGQLGQLGQFANLGNTKPKFPKYSLVEYDDNYIYNFEVPGYVKDDIKLVKKGYDLTITGNRIVDLNGGKVIYNEGNILNSFDRTISLVGNCSKISGAIFIDGILYVTISKVTKEDEEEVPIN